MTKLGFEHIHATHNRAYSYNGDGVLLKCVQAKEGLS